jgi:hypothetical protein
MESLIFEQLENLGLLKGNRPNRAALARMSKNKILDFLRESAELTSAAGLSREQSLFSQSATLSLSGGRLPCFELDHRLATAQNLSQYAALYADKIYIYNFLAEHVAHRENHDEEEELKAEVYRDLVVLGYFRPLIEGDRIVPITPPSEFCPGCFGSNPAVNAFDQRRNTIRQWLRERYLNETEVKLERTGDRFGFLVTGTDVLLEHGTGAWIKKELPEELKAFPRLMTRLNRGETIKLSKRAKRLQDS